MTELMMGNPKNNEFSQRSECMCASLCSRVDFSDLFMVLAIPRSDGYTARPHL
jgi:hypothetical protein